nr:glycerophosphodiester phosphodiesterase family protein [uncultured Aminipila sp.]
MSSRILEISRKYLTKITVVAVALAMATTLAFGQSNEDGVQSPSKVEKTERTYEKMIAHGGGTVEGFDTSSSVDAVMQSIANGFKVIELDMEFSLDNKIIMLHDWDRTVTTYLGRKFDIKLTLNQFNNQLICGKFEPLTFDKLTKILDNNPQVRIVTDTKGDNIKLLTTIANKYPSYVDRMIPQIYDYSEFETVSSLGYKDIIFTLYMQDKIDYSKLLNFIKENDIYAVTIGKDYWVKGLPQKLSKEGIKVYTHPVYTVEEAQEEFAKGAYGVYSSTLKPSEIEGFEAEYYLMQTNGDGKRVKLTDATLQQNQVRTIRSHGDLDYKAFKYKLDGKGLEERLAEIEDSASEAHELTIELWDISGTSVDNALQPLYIMKYTLTKNAGQVRILDKKYDYRLKPLKKLPEFEAVMSEIKKDKDYEEIVGILSKAFIAKAGKYYYFNNGMNGSYSVGDELMSPQKSVSGNVIVPLAETVKELGASNITMDSGRYIYIAMNNSRTVSQVYSNFVRKDTYNTKISVPISLYRGKAMAGGEIIAVASDRDFAEEKGILIILPKNCKISEKTTEKLIELADLLYKN